MNRDSVPTKRFQRPPLHRGLDFAFGMFKQELMNPCLE